MTSTERHIVESYSSLLEGLSSNSKLELIESLSKSLRAVGKNTDNNFYKAFGAFSSTQTAKEIIADIKSSRKFRKR